MNELDPKNYSEHVEDRGIRFEFAWPEEIQRKHDAEQKEADEESRLLMFPFQCRKLLDEGVSLTAEQLLPFWETVHAIAAGPSAKSDEFGHVMIRMEDSLCGGIAVLLTHHLDWLLAVPARMTWCREKLDEIMRHPPQFSLMDTENAIGNRHWDAFAAESGIILLAENKDDTLGRVLVAVSVVAYRHSTTALTMARAFRCRERLGEDFNRMLNLAIRGVGVRALPASDTNPIRTREMA